MNWERFWMFGSAILLIAGAVMLWRNNLPAAFVIAALGACAWFLSYRSRLRSQIRDDEEANEVSEDRDRNQVEEVSTGSGSDRANDRDEL